MTERQKNEIVVKRIIGFEKFEDKILYKRSVSKASCYLSNIQSFIFGGFSSRFWTLRKHINSQQPMDHEKNLPFYCWDAITI